MVETDIELGYKVQDRISGFTGIVTTVGEHISGCTRIGVRPCGDEEAVQRGEHEFFYEDQLEVLDDETEFVDEVPENYFEHGLEIGEFVQDSVTGFRGVVQTINYKMWNCPQVSVQAVDSPDKSEEQDNSWFDIVRLESRGEVINTDFWDSEEEASQTSSTGSAEDFRSRNDSR